MITLKYDGANLGRSIFATVWLSDLPDNILISLGLYEFAQENDAIVDVIGSWEYSKSEETFEVFDFTVFNFDDSKQILLDNELLEISDLVNGLKENIYADMVVSDETL